MGRARKSRIRKYTLVIIDMQPYFGAARHPQVITNCLREVRAAKALDNRVMVVRLAQYGGSLRQLYSSLRNYEKKSYIKKWTQSGAREVLEELQRTKRTHLRFCGVNTDLCVMDTVVDIAHKYPKPFKIEVVADACNSWSHDRHKIGLETMAKNERITVLQAA